MTSHRFEEFGWIDPNAKEFMTNDQICKFTPNAIFPESLLNEEFLIESLRLSITVYHQEIERLIRLALLMLAEVLPLQKGNFISFEKIRNKKMSPISYSNLIIYPSMDVFINRL